MKNITQKVKALLNRDIRHDGTMVKLSKDSNNLLALFERFGFRMISAVFPNEVNYKSRLHTMYVFAGFIHQMYLHHGEEFVVHYLKVGQLAIQKYIAGEPLSSLKELKDLPFPRLSNGLPKVIPSVDRGLIRAGHSQVIRFWLTLFSVYRVISIPGELKTSTITDIPTYDSEALLGIANLISKKWDSSMLNKRILKTQAEPLLLESASAGHSVSVFDYFNSAFRLKELGLFSTLKDYSTLLGYTNFLNWVVAITTDTRLIELMDFTKKEISSLGKSTDSISTGGLGKLSLKEEAAGKVRVFAMVDPITQSVLKPLHNMIFDLLRRLPNDAMADQHLSTLRCMEKVAVSQYAAGYDLSAATDRLPIAIQIHILNMVEEGMGDLWAKLLTDRDYLLRSDKYTQGKTLALRYATGQPMGAYSSWGMLDLTHHLLVQVSALRANKIQRINMKSWFTGYEMLGDDVVIFDPQVASEYLIIMRDLGVPINLGKSVVANNATFEFAKVTGHKGNFVSALSWKSFMSQDSMMGRANIAFSLFNKGFVHKRVITWISGICRKSKFEIGNINPTLIAIFTMCSNSGRVSLENLLKLLVTQRSDVRYNWYKTILMNVKTPTLSHLLPGILSNSIKQLPFSKEKEVLWNTDKPWAMMSLLKPLEVFRYKHRELDSLALSIAIQLTRLNMPLWNNEPFAHLTPETINASHEQFSTWSLYEQEMWTLVYPLYEMFREKFIDLSQFTSKLEGNWVNPTIEELWDWTDKMERFTELEQFCTRTVAKAMGENKAFKLSERSPLSALKFFLKMNYKRPGWSFTNFGS